jgi:hypothetical protein
LVQTVFFSDNTARNAGDIFTLGSDTLRPAQNNNLTYGGGIVLQKIGYKDGRFSFKEIKRFTPQPGPYSRGIHTLNVYNNTIIIDGKNYFNPPLTSILKSIHCVEHIAKKTIKLCLPTFFHILWKNVLKPPLIKHRYIRSARKLPASKNEHPQFIVCFTSYGKRLRTTAPYAAATLLAQTPAPDRVILWISEDETIPSRLRELTKYGLELRSCKDYGPYKKLIPALLAFPDDILITADDDIAYPKDWFSKLKESYFANPSKISIHRSHEICFDQSGHILPYSYWHKEIRSIELPQRLFPTSGGGVLFPPHSLGTCCTNTDEFLHLCPMQDDIWYWAMARLNGASFHLINNGYNQVNNIDINVHKQGLWRSSNQFGANDAALDAILNQFPEIVKEIN